MFSQKSQIERVGMMTCLSNPIEASHSGVRCCNSIPAAAQEKFVLCLCNLCLPLSLEQQPRSGSPDELKYNHTNKLPVQLRSSTNNMERLRAVIHAAVWLDALTAGREVTLTTSR